MAIRDWVRTNWFKVSLLATCVVVLITAIYHREQERNHRLTLECRSLGEKIDKEINPPDPDPFGTSPIDPEFYYSPELRVCFYYGGHWGNGFGKKFLINAYTNKKIASCAVYNVITRTLEDMQEESRFDHLKELLFSERKPRDRYEIDLIRQSLK